MAVTITDKINKLLCIFRPTLPSIENFNYTFFLRHALIVD